MNIVICDKCGKAIKGDIHKLIYKSLLKASKEIHFCDNCFDEIVNYKKIIKTIYD